MNPLAFDFTRGAEGGIFDDGLRASGAMHGVPSLENMPEVAAKLLFTSVKWAKNITCFRLLPYRDQVNYQGLTSLQQHL